MSTTDNKREPAVKYKDPDAVKDYEINWAARLSGGETIVASTWAITVAPDDSLTVATPSPTFTDTAAKLWVAGGTKGLMYWATNHITTSAGRQDDASIIFIIAEM